MRKLVAGFASSIDGYIEGPSGEVDWIIIDKEIDFAEQAKRFDTYLYGRRTYEAVVKSGRFSAGKDRHFVFSTTLQAVQPGFHLVSTGIAKTIRDLKEEKGRDIALFGGASLLASLLDLGLVDEISISFIPVLIGKGKPMIEAVKQYTWLVPIQSRQYSNGTIRIDYAVKQ